MANAAESPESVHSAFAALCALITELDEDYDYDAEHAYLDLLRLLQRNLWSRPWFVEQFVEIIGEYRNARQKRPRLSLHAIAFCMHSLRWPELLDAAQREHRAYFVPRRDDFLWYLMDAYEDDWSGTQDFSYYRNQT